MRAIRSVVTGARQRIRFAAPRYRGSHSPTRSYGRRASGGDSPRLALGVGTPTLPPLMPTFAQDDGRFRFSAEPFIVIRSHLAVVVTRKGRCSRKEIGGYATCFRLPITQFA